MDEIVSLLKDPLLQAFVFSPLMGVVFSLLLMPPTETNSVTFNQPVNFYNTEVRNYYGDGKQQADTAGGFALLFALMAPAFYLRYGSTALHWLTVADTFVLAFGVAGVVQGYAGGYLLSVGWLPRLALPPIIAALAFPIISQAREISNSYTRAGNPVPVSLFEPAGQYMILQALGILFLATALLLAALSTIHNAALGEASEMGHGYGIRGFALRATRRYGKVGGLFAVAFLVVAELFITGLICDWFH